MRNDRITTLTSIRFFMIIIIVFTHFYFLSGDEGVGKFIHTHIQNPSLPVEFFFVMSGFGLTFRKLAKKTVAIDGKFSLLRGLKFGISRIKKLYWLYVLTMASMIPLTALWTNWELNNWTMSFVQTFIHFFADLSLTQSIFGISSIANELNGPCWFLSTLFMLYCIYPFLEKVNNEVVKLSSCKILAVLFFMELLSYAVLIPCSSLKDYSPFDYLAYGSPITRVFSFISGILICDLLYKRKAKLKLNSLWELLVVFLAVLWIYNMRVYFDPQDNYAIRYPIVAVVNNLLSVAMVYVFAFEGGCVSRMLQNKYLVTLGACSMYIYMLHWPAIYYVYGAINQLLSMTIFVKLLTSAVIIVVISILTYIVWKFQAKVIGCINSHFG